MKALIYSNLYISVAAALLALGSYRLLGVEPSSYGLIGLVFCATMLVYNLDRLVGGQREDQVESTTRHLWIRRNRLVVRALIVGSAVGVVAALPFLEVATIAVLVPVGVLSIGYCVPLWRRGRTDEEGRRRGIRFKELPGVKTLAIATVWAVATVILPALEAGVSIQDASVAVVFLERLIFVFAITLPFDVRDLARDREAGIRTLAVLLGARRALALAIGLMAIFTAITGTRFLLGGDIAALVLFGCGLATLVALVPAFWPGERDGLYYVGLLDGTLLLQAALLLWI